MYGDPIAHTGVLLPSYGQVKHPSVSTPGYGQLSLATPPPYYGQAISVAATLYGLPLRLS